MEKLTNTSTTVVDPSIEIAALRLEYPGFFGSDEITDDKVRLSFNATVRSFDGITSIVKILYANAIEHEAMGEGAVTLNPKITYGLFEALVSLAEQGHANATQLGRELFRQTKGGA